jgi:hypothetical protein
MKEMKHLIAVLVVSPFFIYFVFALRAVIFTTLEKLRPARPHSCWSTLRNDLVSVAANFLDHLPARGLPDTLRARLSPVSV